ncbi:hypothetical protein ECD93_07910 [Acinetobacter baumannii]|nr:hypothetical protein [Acinetobacter baumannii]
MAALAISGGSLVACQLQPAFQTKEAPTLFNLKSSDILALNYYTIQIICFSCRFSCLPNLMLI